MSDKIEIFAEAGRRAGEELARGSADSLIITIGAIVLAIFIGMSWWWLPKIVEKLAERRTQRQNAPIQPTKEQPIQRQVTTTEVHYCMYCGERIPEGAHFCIKCGHKIQYK